MKLPHPYDLIIGLDRSDKKADLCLLNTATDQRQFALIDTSPEALWEWLLQLRQAYPQARVALCLEQPAGQEGVGPGKRGNELTSWHRDAKRRGFAAMARKMRIEYAGAAHHVMARGEGG
jgi:hypothetical protein